MKRVVGYTNTSNVRFGPNLSRDFWSKFYRSVVVVVVNLLAYWVVTDNIGFILINKKL
jgi:hypothetical protein